VLRICGFLLHKSLKKILPNSTRIKDKEKTMITVANLGDALPILIKDDSVFEQLKTDFPAILADLVTFKNNPNCTCRGRVIKFFTEQLEQNKDVLEKYVNNPSALQAEIDQLVSQRVANNYAGKIFEIQKGDQAWQAFAQSVAGKAFRTFSVVERENTVAVYFL
jgi:hypothetical protein